MDRSVSTHRDGRWFGTGHSTLTDPGAAGAEAAAAAITGTDPVVVFVFCSVGHHTAEMLDAVRERVAADTVIVGCSTSGQLSGGATSKDGVVVAAWGGTGFAVRTHVSRDISNRLRDSGVEAASCLGAVDHPHRALLMLGDGLSGDHHEIVRGAFSVAGAAVPLVGGCAGDQLTFTRTYQFHGGRDGVEILSDALVGVAIGSDAPLGVGIAHGWRKTGSAMIVTRSQGGRVHELDGEPALDVLLRLLGLDESILDDPDAFRQVTFPHPLGLSRRSGEDIRVIHDGDRSDRSVVCLADVPEGALAWLMETDPGALAAAAGQSGRQALDMLAGRPALGSLVFDCSARRVTLGEDGVGRERDGLLEALPDVPFAGFYTNGEFARVRGALGMHHFTVVTLALA
ncbi:FIST C-terminal domain-containing protein [Actinoplanes hulinensis]|uniref:FIST C-terminal domain-containing protein n=1 Tax=Actinoplanes hulinensis TaxID=1144547 RepID=A0ABS7BCH1_9ACTN|nr:FIST N-terminal domain-containing protein [Actinoplanes hulinensis]MBW6438733.1 FIST C-terminal domain-containing protein [Actinoplanes hulinensis]